MIKSVTVLRASIGALSLELASLTSPARPVVIKKLLELDLADWVRMCVRVGISALFTESEVTSLTITNSFFGIFACFLLRV